MVVAAGNLYCNEFVPILERHNLTKEQIYNADKAGLFWSGLPSKTLAVYSENLASGYKLSKERIN